LQAAADGREVTAMTPSSPGVSRRMSRQLRTGTSPERALRTELHRRGRRFRVDFRFDINGLRRRRADIVFTRLKVAVFVDGCFWHRCPEHATFPKANQAWWAAKLTGNVERDRDTDDRLGHAGWSVIRVWEHEESTSAADRVEAVLDATRRACAEGSKELPAGATKPPRHEPRGDNDEQRLKGEA
jgi:DNA mismatch endonuclease, patch repair protein